MISLNIGLFYDFDDQHFVNNHFTSSNLRFVHFKSFGNELIEKSYELGFQIATLFLIEEKEYENADNVNAPSFEIFNRIKIVIQIN